MSAPFLTIDLVGLSSNFLFSFLYFFFTRYRIIVELLLLLSEKSFDMGAKEFWSRKLLVVVSYVLPVFVPFYSYLYFSSCLYVVWNLTFFLGRILPTNHLLVFAGP